MPPIRYVLVAFLASVVMGASVVALTMAVIGMIEIGTCASGNTAFQISRECPESTPTVILFAVGASFGIVLAVFIWLARGLRFHIPPAEPVVGEAKPAFTPGFHFSPVKFHTSEVDDPGPWVGVVVVIVGIALGALLGVTMAEAWIPDTG